MTLELVPFRGHTVPVLNGEISRYNFAELLAKYQYSQQYMGAPTPVTTYGNRPAEPISSSFEGFVWGMLYADGPVAAVEAYRLRVFGQAPLLYQEMKDGRPGDLFDDDRLDRLRTPWPGGNLGDLMKRALVYGDFAGNAFIVDLDDELVLLRPDWVEIVLSKRMVRGGQVGWRQVGIVYYEGGLGVGDGVAFLPGEYCHFVPGLPDPLATFRGMSWLTPLVREVQADKSAGDHKVAFFENAASPNLAVSLPKEITPAQFKEFVDKMDSEHRGATQAYKTLYTAGGADVTVIGANMQQMDFSAVQGKGETRIANAGGVSPALLSFSEGMQGSSLNAGNFVPAKRNFVDTTMRDLWTNWAGSIQKMDAFAPPEERKSRLSYDPRDIPFLRDDEQDIARRQQTQASTISSLITAGYKPDSAQTFVVTDDPMTLEHTGLTSVQLMPPGSQDTDGDGVADVEAEAADEYEAALDEFRAVLAWRDEILRRAPYPGQRYRHGWIPVALGPDPLGIADRSGGLLGPDDALEGSARADGRDGSVVAALIQQGREPVAMLATLKSADVDTWDPNDEDNSLAFVDREVAGEIADALGAVASGRARSKEVSGADIGDVFVHANDGGVDVSVLAYSLRPDADDEYRSEREGERKDLEREQAARDIVEDDDRTDEELAQADAEELAEFDAETAAGLAELQARRDAHTVQFTRDQADDLQSWLRAFAARDDAARSYIERRDYYDIRVDAGRQGGGRFRKLSDIVGALLNDWLSGKGDADDPLDEFESTQLRTAAKGLGIPLPRARRGASPDETRNQLKLAILKDARARFRADRDSEGDEPRQARITLSSPKYRDVDAGVYQERNGKVSLYRESSTGQRGSRIASFDDLAGLEQWGRDNDEPQVAQWAASERAPVKKAAPRKAPAKKAPAKKAVAPAPSLEERVAAASTDILAAYRRLARGSGSYIKLTDLRRELPGHDRDAVDEALRRYSRQRGVNVIGETAAARTRADDEAAVMIGRQPAHLIAFEDVEPTTRREVSEPEVQAAAVSVVDAYHRARRPGSSGWVKMVDLRRELGDHDRDAVDEALKRIGRVPGADVIGEVNQKILTQEDRAAAVFIGGRRKDLINIEDDVDLSGITAPAAPPAKAAPRKAAKSAPASLGLRHPDAAAMYETLTSDRIGLAAGLDVGLVNGRLVLSPAAVEQLRRGRKERDGTIVDTPDGPAMWFFGDLLPLANARFAPGKKAARKAAPAREEAAPLWTPAARQRMAELQQQGHSVGDSIRIAREEHGLSLPDSPAKSAPAKATPKPKREPLGDPAAKLSSLRALGDREAARDELDLLLLDDLKTLAREAGVATSGRKRDVVDRIAEKLDGGESGKAERSAAIVTAIDHALAGTEGNRSLDERIAGNTPTNREVLLNLRAQAASGELHDLDALQRVLGAISTRLGGDQSEGTEIQKTLKRPDTAAKRRYRLADEEALAAVGRATDVLKAVREGRLLPSMPKVARLDRTFQFSHNGLTTAIDNPQPPDVDGTTRVDGTIRDADGSIVGSFHYHLDPATNTAHMDSVGIAPEHGGKGFTSSFVEYVEDQLESQGYTRFTVDAAYGGGLFWARRGFGWNEDQVMAFGDVPARIAQRIANDPNDPDAAQLRGWLDRFGEDRADWPSPQEIANSGPLGESVMNGSSWRGEKNPDMEAANRARENLAAAVADLDRFAANDGRPKPLGIRVRAYVSSEALTAEQGARLQSLVDDPDRFRAALRDMRAG